MAMMALLASTMACGGQAGEPGETADTGSTSQAVASPDMAAVAAEPIERGTVTCARLIKAQVVALDQVYTYNRFGAYNPVGMMYALKRDVVAIDSSKAVGPGNARLRTDKRPRPLTLRANVGDCLQIQFTNWLAPTRAQIPSPSQSQPSVWTGQPDPSLRDDSPYTRRASVHVQGLPYLSLSDDGAFVGTNASSLVNPGGSFTYTFHAPREGAFFMYSMGASFGGQGDGGSTVQGLFGAVNVEPAGSSWYRSKVSAATLLAARLRDPGGSKLPVNNPDGTPRIDYEARDTQNRPLLNILDTTTLEIAHGDLEAIITGYTKTSVGTSSSVDQGHFREITTVYHDEIKAVQAFDELETNRTFHSVRDGFGVNYGVAGLGAELLANRAKIGPTKDCGECLYEEFFLESWANGDPALNVEKDSSGKAVRALFPDDPSNVHHSYLGDPVRIRNIHAGPAETHVFHLHAHQWKLSPGEDGSNYLDSQTIGPGSAFTYDINYGGSGNRNLTPGDSIHHCHLYPHFAQGMWALWRVHDVFEAGTSDRRLPDAEIAGGTPNPAVIPIPARGMPPMPTYTDTQVTVNGVVVTRPAFPGYPFYIAGTAGHRPPQPPRDLEEDGGLPRHLITKAIGPSTYGLPGKRFYVEHHALDAKLLPQAGTPLEQKAMAFHGGTFPSAVPNVNRPYYTGDKVASYPAYSALGSQSAFYVNGRGPIEGAPFADPCPKDAPVRNYRAAYLQLDLVNVNRARWHDPQARIMVLNQDVTATQKGHRPPEPFFFRAESGECINFYATNLVPKDLAADDFQIYTPTDTIGQHIHLVKFDVTASDGAGNGWNYEDGTFSFQEVLHRIELINTAGGAFVADGTVSSGGPRQYLQAKTHSRLGVLGAQTTTQRWWADPLRTADGKDRALETVFTHDHFGPSSHQQHGLYGGLIVEPKGSTWRDPQTGVFFGSRAADGGPTSWRADVLTANSTLSYREFALAFADYSLLYDECGKPVNPPNYKEEKLPWAVGFEDAPAPEAISAADPGGMLINYHNEPIPLRIGQRASRCGTLTQRKDLRGDMSNVFRSDVHGDPYTPLLRGYEGDRIKIRLIQGAQEEQHSFTLHGHKWLREMHDPDSGYFNAQAIGISEHFEFFLTNGLPAIGGTYATADYMYQSASNGDLWNGMWGIMRTYKKRQKGDKTLADLALEAAASLTLEPAALAVREQTPEFGPSPLLEMPTGSGLGTVDESKDPLIQESDEVGDKGEKIATRTVEYDLEYAAEMEKIDPGLVKEARDLDLLGVKPVRVDSCPRGSVVRLYKVSAIDALNWLPGGTLSYSDNFDLHDPDAILFAKDAYLTALQKGHRRPEPLILRARAGECVQVELTNRLPQVLQKTPQWAHHSAITPYFNVNQVRPSNHVSLHPQLVHYDVNVDDGANVGLNARQTVAPGARRVYRWYTGDFRGSGGISTQGISTPVEFGIVNLRNVADVVNHGMHGGIGALIIEPPGATWTEDLGTDAQARVQHINVAGKQETFRELVLLFQDGLGLHSNESKFQDTDGLNSGTALRNLNGIDDSQDTGMKAFNYRTEPLWARLGMPPQTDLNVLNDQELGSILSDTAHGPPTTPLFTAVAGEPLRMRVGHPSGHSRQHAFSLHGAQWSANAWAKGAQSLRMGPNPDSFAVGTQGGMSVMQSWNFIPDDGAGGPSRVKGDHLYRDMASFQWSGGGLWGVLRVQ